jgi:hypothetical protein
VPDRQAPPVGANPRTSLPLSLAAPWARSVGAVLSPARSFLSLSYRPHLSAHPQPPAHDPPPWTRPCLRVLRPRNCTFAPFEPRALLAHLPSLTCALSRTPSPSLSLCARGQRAPPLPTVDRHRARIPYVASVSSASLSATRDTLWFAHFPSGWCGPPLTGAFVVQPEPRCRRSQAPSHPRRPPSPPEFALEVSNLLTPLVRLLMPFCPRDCSPELVGAAISLPRRVQRPLVLPRQREAHGQVRHTALNAPELFLKPLEPHRGQSPRLRRSLVVGSSNATAFRFHQCGSDRNPPIWIWPLSPLPLTCAPALGPGRSACPSTLTLGF